uniref:DNA-3-methyladenine glycosylase III n=1 Tax=Candidatus Kentrum sp. TUN TaxID=2126343 RepID=A0A450ZNR9_9GAMM|nr:MAG: DNA-3-methyladenine glycosylase III [Candidatus Kentron sp. TUN]VFK55529.1 MAG: DNA-3-methyladenine glycosylase III [Candidatus Kentron sp. TUN]VFK61664.1 MAG: DNA-3-methyladenine glycosylase III [Candidatus Kentron sp. TUN]
MPHKVKIPVEKDAATQNGIQNDCCIHRRLLSVYQTLDEYYGPQDWWPGDSSFEIMVGAVLTQNTAWSNVEKAIGNLKAADCLDADAIVALPAADLAELIRPSGYFNLKAKRLQYFCRWYTKQGQYDELARLNTLALRDALLSTYGIGPETADDILLYAFDRPVFVIDAYTRRIFSRLEILDGDLPYEVLRSEIEGALPADSKLFNQYHALIVQHGKDICRKRPRCAQCCLRRDCASRETN